MGYDAIGWTVSKVEGGQRWCVHVRSDGVPVLVSPQLRLYPSRLTALHALRLYLCGLPADSGWELRQEAAYVRDDENVYGADLARGEG